MLSIFATFSQPLDSLALYNDLLFAGLNVTDLINQVVAYGEVDPLDLPTAIFTLIKYGVEKITINNPSK
mgnify:CR=1 FL=1